MIRLIKSLAANLFTLALAFVLAVGIWGVAVREGDPERQRRLDDIPIEVIGRPSDTVISGLPETLEIQVQGPASVVDPLAASDFSAEIDLTNVPPGETEVPLALSYDEELVEIVWQSVEEATVNVERIITREIPVSVEVRGNVARGYDMGEPFVDPATITVTGVASRVESLAEARTQVFVDSAQQDVVITRRPTFYDRQGNTAGVAALDLATDEVVVTIPVDQLAGFAAKPIIVDWEGEPATGYRLLNVNVEPDSVLVTGPPSVLDLLTRVRTEPIDITGLRETITMPVTLDLPQRVQLDEVQPVLVSIEIEPILTTHVINKLPEIRALGEGLTMTTTLEEVRVFLFGPLDKLDSLLDEDVRITVDLFGLGVGTFNVEPDADVFVSDVEVRSIRPSQLTIELTSTLTTTEGVTETVSLTEMMHLHDLVQNSQTALPWLLTLSSVPPALCPVTAAINRRERNV